MKQRFSKIVLLFPPFSPGFKSKYGMPPLGVTYLATVLKNNKVKISIIDAQMEGLTMDQIEERIKKEKPDLLGISVFTQYFVLSKTIAERIKQVLPKTKIVFGGCHINSTKDETFKYTTAVDYLVYGEGEYALLELVKGESLEKIKGLIYRDNNKIKINEPREFIENLNALPYPDFNLIQNFNINFCNAPYANKKPMISILASRGCPYNCAFCDIHHTNGRKLRLRSVDDVIEEIKYNIKKYNIKYVIFKDSTFTINKKWILDFCEKLIEDNLKVGWHCNSRVDTLDEEMLRLMKKAGCNNISFGVESGSQRILNLLRKRITIRQIVKTFKILNKVGVESHAAFIIGSPTETLVDVKKTIFLAKKIKPTFAQFCKGVGYPNTAFYDMAVEKNLIDPYWYTKTTIVYGESYLIDPTFGGEIQPNFDTEEWIKIAHRGFYLRPGYVLTAIKKVIKQPGFILSIISMGSFFMRWMFQKEDLDE